MSTREFKTVKPPYCRFYIVRHGESEANLTGYIAGHLDARLTPLGKQQAHDRSLDLKAVQFADVFASDLLRAHQTAKILAKQHQLVVKTTQVLREKFYGKYEGTSYEEFNGVMKELLKEYEGLLEEEQRKHRLGGEIESDQEVFERMQLFLRETALAYPGENVMVVCHGGIMKEFLIRIGYAPREQLKPGAVKNLGYFVVDCDGVEFFFKQAEGVEKGEVKI